MNEGRVEILEKTENSVSLLIIAYGMEIRSKRTTQINLKDMIVDIIGIENLVFERDTKYDFVSLKQNSRLNFRFD